MAVETRYVVIRTDKSNKEQEVMTFTDKRAADEYDKMLDMADDMFELLQQDVIKGQLEINDEQCEALSIFLAKQREDVLIALQAKKKPTAKASSKKKKADENQPELGLDASANSSKKPKSETESVSHSEETEDNLVDFVIEKDDAA